MFNLFLCKKQKAEIEKLKSENEELKSDMYNMIMKENEHSGIAARFKYKMLFTLSNLMWMAAPKDEHKFRGFN